MRAVVLVGGEGTRLRPLTYRIPKPLLPVVEVPMLERAVHALAAVGVDEVVLSMGYRPDAFREALPDARCGPVAVRYAVEPEPLDTGGGIGFAAREAAIAETFFVLNVDVMHDFDLQGLLDLHRAAGAEATVALSAVIDPSDFGLVVADVGARVTSFVEKGQPRDASMGNLINAGIYVFEPSVIDRIAPGSRVHIETDVFPQMAAEGRLFAREMPGWWLDVGTRERYLDANRHFLVEQGDADVRSRIGDGAEVAGDAALVDSVVGAGSLVATGARIEGSVLLPGCRVGAGALVRDSVLGTGAVVEAGARVESTLVACEEVAAA